MILAGSNDIALFPPPIFCKLNTSEYRRGTEYLSRWAHKSSGLTHLDGWELEAPRLTPAGPCLLVQLIRLRVRLPSG